MLKHSTRFWIVLIFIGWSVDFLFWQQAFGVNFALFVSLFLTVGIALLCAEGIRPDRKSLVLIPFICFFTTMTFVRQEPLTVFVCVMAAFGLMAVLAVTYVGGNWMRYSLVDYGARLFRLFASVFTRGAAYINKVRLEKIEAEWEDSEAAAARWERFWPVIRGILIAIPIVVIFASLLASADLVFEQRLNDLADIFSIGKLPEYTFRGIYILALAYLFGGVMLHAASESRDDTVGSDSGALKPFLGFTEASIILISVVALFASFVAVQFQYFFGGEKNIDVAGYTYAEYARRGFGELIAVAICSLLLLLALSAYSRRSEKRQRAVFTGLGIALVGLVLVMVVSAFQRILLYEAAYGFSRLRTYTHVFLIWLGLLLVAVIVLEIVQRQRAFALMAVVAAAGFVTTLSLINVDGLIVHQNVQRTIDGKELDIKYLESLSEDAIPAIAEEFRAAPESSALYNDLGRVLAHYVQSDLYTGERSWRSYNLPHRRAVAAIDDLDVSVRGFNDGRQEAPAIRPIRP